MKYVEQTAKLGSFYYYKRGRMFTQVKENSETVEEKVEQVKLREKRSKCAVIIWIREYL